jgi:methyl-accepting chemotaxis protein
MLKSFTINQKLWLSFSFVLFGYFVLLIVAFSHAFSNEFLYQQIQDNLLPMKRYCQNAEHAYFQQLSFYDQAITHNEGSFLDDARAKAVEAEKSLLRLQKMNVDTNTQAMIQKIIKHYEIFTANAYHKFKRDVSKSQSIQSYQKGRMSSHQDMFSANFNKNRIIIQECFQQLYRALNQQISSRMQNSQKKSHIFKLVFLAVSIFFAIVGYYIIKRTIKKNILFPLFDIQNFLKRSIDGRQPHDEKMSFTRSDEIAQTVRFINAYIDKSSQLLSSVKQGEIELEQTLQEFECNSKQMLSDMEQINNTGNEILNKASELTHYIHEMNKSSENVGTNIIGISATTEHVAENMSETSESIDKMTASVSYIARSTEEGMNISENIMEMASQANTTINSLGEAAKEIGKVTGVIKRIAVQTNLLALNASIEASTAGEAGKGFAVVANKIKQFASQSATSAEDIASRIEGVQSKTENAIEVINNISETIDMVSVTIGFIADAVDQQNRSAGKISQSVQNSDSGSKQIARSISEATDIIESMSKYTLKSTRGAQEMTEMIQGLNDKTQSTKRFSRQMATKIQELNRFVEKIYH